MTSLAESRAESLGLPSTFGTLPESDVWKVLAGDEVAADVAVRVHDKLAWAAGRSIIGHLEQTKQLRTHRSGLVVRGIASGLGTASFRTFPDDSHLILISRLLQDTIIAVTNLVEYFDAGQSLAQLSVRQAKRERLNLALSFRMTAMMRNMAIHQRLWGTSPLPVIRMDKRGREIAGQITAGAVMFVVAHELGHIAGAHATNSAELYRDSSSITISQVQELQADHFAFGILDAVMDGDRETVLWSAFVALMSRQIVDTCALIRTGNFHPRAWERWAVIDKMAEGQDHRNDLLRTAFMTLVVAATQRDDRFPAEHWKALWDDRLCRFPGPRLPTVLAEWDHLMTGTLSELNAPIDRDATAAGRVLLSDLRGGNLNAVLERTDVSERVRAKLWDMNAPLAFSAVRRLFEGTRSVWSSEPDAFAIYATRLMASHLKSDHPDDG